MFWFELGTLPSRPERFSVRSIPWAFAILLISSVKKASLDFFDRSPPKLGLREGGADKLRRHLLYNDIIKSPGMLISANIEDVGYQHTAFEGSSKF
jgi:hypothetical protein